LNKECDHGVNNVAISLSCDNNFFYNSATASGSDSSLSIYDVPDSILYCALEKMLLISRMSC